jgi:hypothetical protein
MNKKYFDHDQNSFYSRHIEQVNANELKIASDHTFALGISKYTMTTVLTSYDFMNLAYMEYLIERLHGHGHQNLKLILNHLRFSIKGENPLHILAVDEHFLHSYISQLQSAIHDEDDHHKLANNFIHYPVLQNQ